jgi:hypothetical protein
MPVMYSAFPVCSYDLGYELTFSHDLWEYLEG